MNTMNISCRILATALFLFAPCGAAPAQSDSSPRHALVVVGPSSHPPGTHEVAAGGRLMKYGLENSPNLPSIQATVSRGWPQDSAVLEAADTVIFMGDTFPPQRLPETGAILDDLSAMMDRGCGIVCVHYATGLRAEDVADDGDHPLLKWMGGYFATGCEHHQSIARIYRDATIEPASPQHPVSRGWSEFTLHDEPYINNYFGKDNNRLAPNVTALATSMLPPESPQREIVAWGVEREDGGRGFAVVMPHFYRSWSVDELRTFIFNGIVWTAGLDVPQDGVKTQLPDLATFRPAAVEPSK